jgi:2-keto-4-pentenoate hydratase/2-oxohepta-3-ene-1,7-dioic acid hydratase in catechol pathway
MAGVLGYTAANDVSARDLQRAENQWFRARAFDTFCPLGPAIATGLRPGDVRIRSWVDGELRQDGTTADMIHVGPASARSRSRHDAAAGRRGADRHPGRGRQIAPGQTVRVEVEGVGVLENPVVDRNVTVDVADQRPRLTAVGARRFACRTCRGDVVAQPQVIP